VVLADVLGYPSAHVMTANKLLSESSKTPSPLDHRTEFLPFSKPDITDEDVAAVVETLRSGWITTGSRCVELERRFAAYVGAPEGIAVCSATAGMHLLLKALNIGPGDEVVTPSMTWVSTVNLIVLAGATPVFVYVDRDTLMAGPEAYEAAITARTRLVVPVHFAGAAADIEPIREIARRRHVALIEDAAHAAGTRYHGERIGASGTSVFSFHPIKNMTTGEGGMVCSDDAALLRRLRVLRFHGLEADAFDRATQGRAPQAEVQEPGYKYNLTDVAAALGLTQLERIDRMNARRAELADRYHRLLTGVDAVLPLRVPEGTTLHAWNLFAVRLDTERAGMTRETFMAKLKEREIGTGIHFRGVHTHRYYRENYPVPAGALANTEWNSERILSLPMFPSMTDDDVDSVVSAIASVLAE
jgi:UDP-4-amino-4-deoxy-L-arabinose-oxoglutarate aminotransferase